MTKQNSQGGGYSDSFSDNVPSFLLKTY